MMTEYDQTPQNDRKKWLLPVGVGCGVLALCLCLGLAGGYFLLQRQVVDIPFNSNDVIATMEIDIPTLPPVQVSTLPPEPTKEPATTFEPTPTTEILPTETAATEASGSGLTGSQSISDTSLFDDFSSEALGWPIFDDGSTIMQYENDAYSIQIVPTQYIDWAYVPVEFSPNYIKFDVWGLPGEQNGTFGVFCQYQDSSNHYYAEFDLQDKKYILAEYYDGEDISFTGEDFWVDTSALLSSPESSNTIELTCTLDSMTLVINGQQVDQVDVTQQVPSPGEMAFFVYTYSFADENGYKVYFDNITVTE